MDQCGDAHFLWIEILHETKDIRADAEAAPTNPNLEGTQVAELQQRDAYWQCSVK
jgi:hypothetical protein